MTNLHCTVFDCVNNTDARCCRPDILVSGKDANERKETSCADFHRSEGNPAAQSAQDSCGCHRPNEELHVRCEAEKCVYNEQGDCAAEQIKVCDCSCDVPTCKSETECHTFRMR